MKNIPERIALCLRDPATRYMGTCVIQAPGAWTRVGPCWVVPGVGWVCYGPGVERWGTSKGLAQLAVDAACKPSLHATAWTTVPAPNLAFALESAALSAPYFREVKEAATAADEWEARGRP